MASLGLQRGSSLVTLTETDTGTLLNYVVDAQIGGKLAQIGARLIDSTSKKLANQFFEKFVACCAQINAGEGASNE